MGKANGIPGINRFRRRIVEVCRLVEALSVAAPGWLPTVIDVPGWAQRYGARVDSWRLPASQAKRQQLAQTYGSDALTLLRAVYAPTPDWLGELFAVEVLRQVLVQNYHIRTDAHGREVITRREADTDGLPPGRARIRARR